MGNISVYASLCLCSDLPCLRCSLCLLVLYIVLGVPKDRWAILPISDGTMFQPRNPRPTALGGIGWI